MTNEHILITFLKEHGKFDTTKENFLSGFARYSWNYKTVKKGDTKVEQGIGNLFLWKASEEGYRYWDNLSDKWVQLCKDFNLTGTIDLESIFLE